MSAAMAHYEAALSLATRKAPGSGTEAVRYNYDCCDCCNWLAFSIVVGVFEIGRCS
jgi:hypothetical protein